MHEPREFVKSNVKKYPFEVLHSVNCKRTTDNSSLTSGMLINSPQLELDNGHLILVHYSGKFLEYEDDTIINLDKINSELKSTITTANKRFRPRINFLYSDNTHSGVSDGVSGIVPLSDNPITIDKNENFCLSWIPEAVEVPDEPEMYTVRIRSIFLETLFELKTESNYATLDFSDYEGTLFLVDIRGKNSTLTSYDLGIKLGIRDFLLPNYCEPKNSVEALEIAYHLERMYFARKEALVYYERANELSNQQFYKDQLSKYKKRNMME